MGASDHECRLLGYSVFIFYLSTRGYWQMHDDKRIVETKFGNHCGCTNVYTCNMPDTGVSSRLIPGGCIH